MSWWIEQSDNSQMRSLRMKSGNKGVHLFTAENAFETPKETGICITEDLITKRNLTFSEDNDLSEKM